MGNALAEKSVKVHSNLLRPKIVKKFSEVKIKKNIIYNISANKKILHLNSIH